MRNILILVAILCLTSCQKKQCWVCRVTVNVDSASAGVVKERFDVGVCDKTKKEIRDYESDAVSSGYIEYTDSFGRHGLYADFKSVDCN